MRCNASRAQRTGTQVSVPCRRVPRTRPEKATEAAIQQTLCAGSPWQGAEQQLERLRLLEEGA